MQEKAIRNLSVIVAVARNGAIGKAGDLLWHISEDLRHFKAVTSGHAVLMGRTTYLSFPRRPLPDRFHIVLSATALVDDLQVPEERRGDVVCVRNVEEALRCLPADEEAFVIGGGRVYAQFLPFCSKAYITEVDADFEADTFFPALRSEEWQVQECGEWQTDTRTGLRFRYLVYKRIDDK